MIQLRCLSGLAGGSINFIELFHSKIKKIDLVFSPTGINRTVFPFI